LQEPRTGRREVVELCWERVQIALSNYLTSQVHCSQAVADSKSPWSKDGQFAIIEALNAEAVAREDYQRVLRLFNDLTLAYACRQSIRE